MPAVRYRVLITKVFFLAFLSLGPSSAPGSEPEGTFVVPDIGRFMGTWLWRSSDGLVSVSSPWTKGASRTLVLNPDLTYEYHQRRDTRDSVLCQGRFSFSEQTDIGGEPTNYLAFENWFESYEKQMYADFEGPDTLHLIGDPCKSCPEHVFVRGRTATFEGGVKQGEGFHRDLWDGLRFELKPLDTGWEIAVRDTTRPGENLARLTPSLLVPGPPVPAQAKREFIFSREVGKSIPGKGTAPGATEDEIQNVRWDGNGVLTIEKLYFEDRWYGGSSSTSIGFTVAIEERRGNAVEGRP